MKFLQNIVKTTTTTKKSVPAVKRVSLAGIPDFPVLFPPTMFLWKLSGGMKGWGPFQGRSKCEWKRHWS